MLVSIVIANYNNEKFINKCLESVANQSYKAIEVIIIDDCSNDASVSIISRYVSRYNNFHLIVNPVNMGVSIARNIGLKKCRGEYLTTLDSDDEYHPDKISNEILCLKDEEGRGIAYSDIMLKRGEKAVLLRSDACKKKPCYKSVLFRECIIPRDILFHKSFLTDLGYGFDRRLDRFEDWDFKIRLFKLANPIFSGGVGTIYNIHDSGLSKGSPLAILNGLIQVFLKNHEPANKIKKAIGLFKLFFNVFYFHLNKKI